MSKSLLSFQKNLSEFNQLIVIHKSIGGAKRGRRYDLEVVNKAAVVLICASWESYCEDLLFEQLTRLSQPKVSSLSIPSALRALMGRRVKSDPDDRAPWRLAGKGWRRELSHMIGELKATVNFLNTPKSRQIDELFERYLGVASLSSNWHWPGMGVKSACKKLDDFVALRGELAHRARALSTVKRKQTEDFAAFATRLVNITEGVIVRHVGAMLPRVARRRVKRVRSRRRAGR